MVHGTTLILAFQSRQSRKDPQQLKLWLSRVTELSERELQDARRRD